MSGQPLKTLETDTWLVHHEVSLILSVQAALIPQHFTSQFLTYGTKKGEILQMKQ